MKTNARLVLCFVAVVLFVSGEPCTQQALAVIKPIPLSSKTKAAMIGFQKQDIRINTNAAGLTSANYPRIACDSKGHVYVVWQDNRDGKFDIYFNYSSDNGATWQADDIKITTTPPGTNYCNSPEIACDDDGSVYIVWVDGRDFGAPNIYFNHSSNYGADWHSDIRLSTTNGPETPFAEHPQVSCDTNGNVYVTWRDNRNNSWDIYFDRSTDYGTNWLSDDMRLDSGTGTSGFPQITCNDQGSVYVVWDDYRNGQGDIYLNSSQDYGATWQAQDIRLDSDLPYPGISSSPQMSADEAGHVYVVWHDSKASQIYYNYSSDYGINWQASDIALCSVAYTTVGCPEIASDDNGNVYVVWDDYRNNHADIFLNRSSDYGVNWLTNEVRLDTDKPQWGESNYPMITCNAQGKVYAVWYDYRNGNYDIYCNRSLNYGSTWKLNDIRVDHDTPTTGYSFWPQVVTDSVGTVYVAWQDNRNGTDDIYFNYARFLK